MEKQTKKMLLKLHTTSKTPQRFICIFINFLKRFVSIRLQAHGIVLEGFKAMNLNFEFNVVFYFSIAFIPRFVVYGVTNAVTLSCHSSHMSVQVDLKYFQWLDPRSLHLRHHSCGSNQYNKTSASFVVPLYGCGTRRRTNDDLLIYTNAVSNSNRNSSFISRVPYIRMPFHCVYRRRYSFMLTTGMASKRHIAKKIKKSEKEGILFKENNPGEKNDEYLFS